jgi:hypothetical protein
MNQLERWLLSEPGIGPRMRDKAEWERRLTQLRYTIVALTPEQEGERASLEAERNEIQARLDAVESELARDPRYVVVDDRPATINEVRAGLLPGEAYLKVAEINNRAFGILITADDTMIYAIDPAVSQLSDWVERVRRSIDGRRAEGRMGRFDVAGSHALYRVITGPAADRFAQSRSVVADFGGSLARLPAGILVVPDRASVDAYNATRREAPFDFTAVRFLAARAPISTAVSPRSFLNARNLPVSAAPQPFIGFAEPVPPPPESWLRSGKIWPPSTRARYGWRQPQSMRRDRLSFRVPPSPTPRSNSALTSISSGCFILPPTALPKVNSVARDRRPPSSPRWAAMNRTAFSNWTKLPVFAWMPIWSC